MEWIESSSTTSFQDNCNPPISSRRTVLGWAADANLDSLRMNFRSLITACVAMAVLPCLAAAAEPSKFHIDPAAGQILDRYCIDCHEEGTEKGKVRLDHLAELSLDARLEMMNRMHEKVHFEEMPPKKEDQPTEQERRQLEDWLSGVLHANNASKLEDKLRMPEYGNKVDHDKLFSGNYKDLPGYTPDRRWLISEFIFDAKMNKLLDYVTQRDIDRKRYSVIGENHRNGFKVNITNPFLLPTHSGVRYYDTQTLDGGHLLTMLTNAKELSAFLIVRTKSNNSLPAVNAIMGMEWEHQKILAARETYLRIEVEPLLRELHKEKHESLLPDYARSSVASFGKQELYVEKVGYDEAKPSNEEVYEICTAMHKLGAEGGDDKALISRCEQAWFYQGVDERIIQLRGKFMRNYMPGLRQQMPKNVPVAPKPPADAELAIIRAALLKHRKAGDTYSAVIAKCVAEWNDDFKRERDKKSVTDEEIGKLVDQLFNKIIERSPNSQEHAEYTALVKSYLGKAGNEKAIEKLIQTVILRTDFVYRQELGEGEADEHGRKRLSPREASYALAYALTDSSPDKELQEAVKSGKLNTREDYRREVERMLRIRSQYYIIEPAIEGLGSDSFTNIPIRKLRFFREFFGYPRALPIFKDNKRFGGNYISASGRAVSEADMLVEHILEQDQNVFENLLTTEDFYVFHSGNNEEMAKGSAYVRRIYDYFKDKGWKSFTFEDLRQHVAIIKETELRGVNYTLLEQGKGGDDVLKPFKTTLSSYEELLGKGQANAVPFSATGGFGRTEAFSRTGRQLGGPEIAKCFNIDLKNWNYPTTQPTRMANRKGILTHPAWLIAFAANTETDPIRRGKWVREKLLAGTVPDVPITVDAVIPEDHHKTLRTRLEKKTEAEYCWGCHERMNPLGLPFEIFDDFGRYRLEEFLENPENLIKKMPDKGPPQDDLRDIYNCLPVDAKGKLVGTGDPKLDGDVKDALDLMTRLGKSTKVRQSIIRHAFRYFMGRNETLSDSKTLIDADQAYVRSGGSFDAVILSLLTSDSFIYRKRVTQ